MDDKNLHTSDILLLSSRDGVASIFAVLGYNVDARLPQTAAALGITAEFLQRQIRHIEQIAVQEDGAEPLYVFLVELTSVTVAATQGLARSLRNRAGNYLLALTDDYERLDFVLLERSLPVQLTLGTMTTRQVSVRPRILTVDRRKPNQVQLRVLRRFTYTEADSDAQYDKLLSAYAVADWSEPLFNNRALFSDYFLNERLRERGEWKERPEQAYHQLQELMSNAWERLSGKPEPLARSSLLEPAFTALGFNAVEGSTGSDGTEPDYRLFSADDADKPVALCLAYAWNRNLDGVDEMRDTGDARYENPGERVVRVLSTGEAPWAIVTNGKLWRLYSARTHSRATNYYEIDLTETLAMSDPNEAFRYFWLFFRAAAFVPHDVLRDGQAKSLSFLDELIEGSEDYAKGLGQRLKDRVFEQVFPHFAEGFMEYLKAQVGMAGAQQGALLPAAQQLSLKREPDEDFRRQVFQGTLTLLYRLLFLLYAESRGLLPVKEQRGYNEHSLTSLKEEIASKADDIVDEAPQKIRKAHRGTADATGLYDRLLKLFAAIDQGNQALNVPHYNGGLFLTTPDSKDHSQEAESARFLLNYKIPDRYLALGLDLLARDEDDKKHTLVSIDYKSLGVRQLGSIYEGLLEFKVRVAPEKMAVIKGKRTEEVIPYRQAVKDGVKVLTIGRGRNAQERVYQTGDVYLENDKQERKATGSYYTPEYIVKYIVEHTVGPVLDEKFEKLRHRLREAQQAYHEAVRRDESMRKMRMDSNEAAKVAHVDRFRKLVDELFDIRVLDPAMGSGHFLVEAVDFICDRILGQSDGFLRAFPWNPLTAFLERTRQEIAAEMERQGVSINLASLTDINLFKRHVLKRCIYGVDLNPMAVELAKVSLWLDCFTLGAPLSFLDHHMKCGNSLIGTTVLEVETELAAKKQGHVSDLFGGPFQGLLSGTNTMLTIARSPDVTVEQSQQSRNMFADFERDMLPYKRALNIWVSRYFGNQRAQEYLRLADTDLVDQLKTGGSGLSLEYREAIAKAESIAREKRFFHWDLEFPEAFIDLERNNWKSRESQGFDAVIGNPPYVRQEGFSDDKPYFQAAHSPVYSGVADLYVYFYHRGLSLIRQGGRFGMITSNKFLRSGYGKALRIFLGSQAIADVIDFRDLPVFEDATSYPLIFIAVRHVATDDHDIRAYTVQSMDEVKQIEEIMAGLKSSLPLKALRPDGWTLQRSDVLALMGKVRAMGIPLRQSVKGKFYRGLVTGSNEAFVIDDTKRAELIDLDPKSSEIIKPYLRGRDITRWRVEWGGLHLIYVPWELEINKFPAIYRHLSTYRPVLQARPEVRQGRFPWYALSRYGSEFASEFERPKIVYQEIATYQAFAYTMEPFFLNNKCFLVPTEDKSLVALLNSRIGWWVLGNLAAKLQHGAYALQSIYMELFPIPPIQERDRARLADLVDAVLSAPGNEAVAIESERTINEIVYKLYDLTQNEIDIVEETV